MVNDVVFADHSLLVPPHLQELYEMYMKEMDEKNLDRVVALDKFTIRTLKVRQHEIKTDSVYFVNTQYCAYFAQNINAHYSKETKSCLTFSFAWNCITLSFMMTLNTLQERDMTKS